MIRIFLFFIMFILVYFICWIGGLDILQRSIENAFCFVMALILGVWFAGMPEHAVDKLNKWIFKYISILKGIDHET